MKVRLNKRTIDEAVYERPGGCYFWDIQQPGFGVGIEHYADQWAFAARHLGMEMASSE